MIRKIKKGMIAMFCPPKDPAERADTIANTKGLHYETCSRSCDHCERGRVQSQRDALLFCLFTLAAVRETAAGVYRAATRDSRAGHAATRGARIPPQIHRGPAL